MNARSRVCLAGGAAGLFLVSAFVACGGVGLATDQEHLLAIDVVSATTVWDHETGKPVVFVPTADNGISLLGSP